MPALLSLERPPSLNQHPNTGRFVVRIPAKLGGGTRWFGSDKAAAQTAYAQWVEEVWPCLLGSPSPVPTRRKEVVIRLGTAAANRRGMTNPTAVVSVPPLPASLRPAQTLREVADSLFALVDSESGPAGRQNVRFRLRLFLERYGSKPANALTPADLIGYKAELVKRYKPEFVNNCLTYSRRLLTFAWESGAVEQPYRLGVLKAVPKGALRRKGLAAENVSALLKEVSQRNRPLATLMLIQLYGVLRPSEAPKVAYSVGELQPYGIDVESKTTRKTGEMRPCLVTPESAALIEEFREAVGERRFYATHNAYRLACNLVGRSIGEKRLRELTGKKVLAPHFLRHTANQLLLDSGVSEEFVRASMGRVRPRVDRTYGRENYEQARQAIRVLSKAVPPSVLASGERLKLKGSKGKSKRAA